MYESAQEGTPPTISTVNPTLSRNSLSTITYESAQETIPSALGRDKRSPSCSSLGAVIYEGTQKGTPPAVGAVKRGRRSESALALGTQFLCLYLQSTPALDALDLGV
jgi:hypothetical protein